MGAREDRIAANESLFRRVNQSIKDASVDHRYHEHELPGFLCECGDLECSEIVHLPLEEYEAVRGSAIRFFVHPGHEIEGAEVVVEDHGSYRVVDKIGEAKQIAIDNARQDD